MKHWPRAGARPSASIAASWMVTATAGVASALYPGAVSAQVEFESDAVKIELSGRFQTQLAGSSCSDFSTGAPATTPCSEDVPALDLFIRRARLTLDVSFNDWISGRFQPDFAGVDEVELKDAWGLLNLEPGAEHPRAQIRIGHFKRPFDGFEMTSSTQILTIERDLDVPGVSGTTALSLDELTTRNNLSDRDVGVMVDGSSPDGRFHYWLAAFNGRGPADNEDLDTQKQLVGRAQYTTELADRPLALSAGAAVTDIAFTRADESIDARYFGAFELFAEWGSFRAAEGPHVQAGVVFGKNGLEAEAGGAPDLEAGDPLAGMLTWQAIGAWKLDVGDGSFVESIEPLFRVTMADPNTDLDQDTVWGFTPGVQIFFGGRNKLALNWDFVAFGADGVDSENSFKAQYQFHF